MATTGDPARLTTGTAMLAALAAAAPATVCGLRVTPDLFGAGLLNPDSAMRLVRLHDIVAAGQPLHAVMRDGSGAGTVLHWSHLLDSVLLLLATPLVAALGWDRALHAAGLLLGPLGMAGLGVAVAWAALPLAGRGWAWFGALAAGLSPTLLGYGLIGVVHHHVGLTVCAVMAGGWALRLVRGGEPVGGVALGAWAGAGLWLSPESLPFSLMAMGAVWVAWFAGPGVRLGRALLGSGTAFLGVSALAWAVDPPASGWGAVEVDRLSLPFVLLALGAAVTALSAWAGAPRLAVLGCGAGAGALWLVAFPAVLGGTEGLMPPAEAAAFFGRIGEMQAVHGLGQATEALLGGVFAAVAVAAFCWRRPSAPLLYALGGAAGLVLLAAAHVRFAAYPAAAGAVMLPVVLACIGRSALAATGQSLARMGLVLPTLLAPVLAPMTAAASPAAARRCPMAGAAALLRSHPGEVVLADVNMTPDLLYRTRVLTVGSLYHRNPAGFMRLRAAWRGVPGAAPSEAVRATGASLVLGCPGGGRSGLVDNLPATTLSDRLDADRPPAWLERLGDAGPGGFVLYRVAR